MHSDKSDVDCRSLSASRHPVGQKETSRYETWDDSTPHCMWETGIRWIQFLMSGCTSDADGTFLETANSCWVVYNPHLAKRWGVFMAKETRKLCAYRGCFARTRILCIIVGMIGVLSGLFMCSPAYLYVFMIEFVKMET